MRRHLAIAALLLAALTAWADQAPLHFAGVVLYPDGSPAAGAKVWLRGWEQTGPRIVAASEAATDGTFAFSAPTSVAPGYGSYTVFARAEGYAYAWTPVMGRSNPVIRLDLMKPIAREGRVLAADGSPVSGVRPAIASLEHVTGFDPLELSASYCTAVLPPDIEASVITETDEQGAFRLRDLPAGSQMTLSVKGPDRQWGFTRVRWTTDPVDRPITIRLMPSGTIRGRVVDAETGRPVAGVGVQGRGRSRAQAVTDEEGRYELAGVAAGTWSVFLSEASTDHAAEGVGNVRVKPGEVTDGVDLHMVAGLEVRGRVTDIATGRPIEGVSILCTPQGREEWEPGALSVMTDADGRYALRAIAGPVWVRPGVMPDGWWRAGTVDSPFGCFTLSADNAPCVLDFVARAAMPLPVLSVRALSPDATPAAYARVLWHSEGAGGSPQWALSDADGRHTFERVMTNLRRIVYAYRGDDMAAEPVVVEPGKAETPNVRLAKGVRPTLTGRVVDTSGEPISGAFVRMAFSPTGPASRTDAHVSIAVGRALTDDEGRFTLLACWPGAAIAGWTVAAGYAERADTYGPLGSAEQRDMGDITLEPATLAVSGVTVDEDGGLLPHAAVEVIALRGTPFSQSRYTTAGADGRFCFDGLPCARLMLRASASGGTSALVGFGPETPEEELQLAVIPREAQALFSYRLSPPLDAHAEKARVRLLQMCRFRTRAPDGTMQQHLGIGFEVKTAADYPTYPAVWIIDDHGRRLERSRAAPTPRLAERTEVVQLPDTNVKSLRRIIVGVPGAAPLHSDQTLDPVRIGAPVPVFQYAAALKSTELADEFIAPTEPGKAQPGKGPYIRARVYLSNSESMRYRLTSARTADAVDLHEAWSFDYRDGTMELDLPDALVPMETELLTEAEAALRLLTQHSLGRSDVPVIQCMVLQSEGDHAQPKLPESLTLTVTPYAVPDPYTVVFQNIPIPPELTKAIEME